MKNKTISQQLIDVQNTLMSCLEELDKAPANRESLSAPYMRADAESKVARQIINAAQAVIRIQRLKNDIALAAGTQS